MLAIKILQERFKDDKLKWKHVVNKAKKFLGKEKQVLIS